jgi:maleylacetoacetate isomerase
MKLYGFFRSGASYRVRIALALKGLAYETVPVHLGRGEHRGEPFRAVNPQRRVPALQLDDGSVLVQSLAIIEYLDEAYPSPRLLPQDPLRRAKVRAVAHIVSCDVHPLNNAGVRRRLTEQFGADENALNSWASHWFHEGFAAVERMIEPGPYAFGDALTLADLCIVPQVFNARRFHIPLGDFPRVVAIDAAARQHPAVAAAAPEAQPDAER